MRACDRLGDHEKRRSQLQINRLPTLFPGLYYTPSRDYDPATGTWREADPAGYVDGVDDYQIEGSAPAGRLDADGTKFSYYRQYTIGGVKMSVNLDGSDGAITTFSDGHGGTLRSLATDPYVSVCIGFDWSALNLDDCDDVGIVQLWKKTSDGAAGTRKTLYNGAFESVRATPAIPGSGRDAGPQTQQGGYIVDEEHGKDSPIYGIGNNGKVYVNKEGISAVAHGANSIWMVDRPGVIAVTALGEWYWFQTYAVVISGPDAGEVLGGVAWTFHINKQAEVTDPFASPELGPTPEYFAAKSLWDAQASAGPGVPKNSPGQIKFPY